MTRHSRVRIGCPADACERAAAWAAPLDFHGLDIRILMIDGNPWFALVDTFRILGHTNPTMACRALKASEFTLSLAEGKRMNFISEAGLYKLILRSDKPNARAFQDWVFGTVFPTIRRDGAYVAGEEHTKTPEEFMRLASAALQNGREVLVALLAHPATPCPSTLVRHSGKQPSESGSPMSAAKMRSGASE